MAHSHSALAARLMLECAGVEYDLRNAAPGLHGFVVRAAGFPRWTVPALRIDELRVQGTLPIARELDRRAPGAGLFPPDGAERESVEAAERWGHDELQPLARRLLSWSQANSSAVRAWLVREVMHLPAATVLGHAFRPTIILFARRIHRADDATIRSDLARLPALLDRADRLLEQGTIGHSPPNAGGLQILTSLRLLLALSDLRPRIEQRPCGQAALALIPDYPSSGPEALPPIPSALPSDWLANLTKGARR